MSAEPSGITWKNRHAAKEGFSVLSVKEGEQEAYEGVG
jgi:hypothetical protein